MEGIIVLLVLVLIFVPIIIISMLSGIRGAITGLENGQEQIRRQVRELAESQRKVEARSRAKADSKESAKVESIEKKKPVERKERPEYVGRKPIPTPEVAKPVESESVDPQGFRLRAEPADDVPSAVIPPAKMPSPKAPGVSATPEKAPSKFEETVNEVLTKIWNWILVGEEHRSKNVTAEYAIASVWLLRVGIIAVVTGIGFFLKLSIERGWVGEEMRTAMCFVAGAGMIAAGLKMLGKKYHVLGQGFLGGGVAVLYFSAYAASVIYGLVPDWVGFGVMALVTVTAGVIAVRADSMTVAVLGIIGGFVSPFFFGGTISLPILYAYLLILSLGVLGVAHSRQWRFLHYLAFLFTYAAFFFSLKGYTPDEHFGITITFLSLFFVVHSAVVYVYHLTKGQETTTLDILHLIANAGIYSTSAYFLINEAAGRPYPAIMSLGLAAYCIAHVAILIRRKIVDRKLMVALTGLAGVFTVWTLPIIFDGASLTISFALLALLLVWLGQKMASNSVTNLGQIVYGIVLMRLLAFDLQSGFAVANETLADYWGALADRIWTFGVSIGSVAAAFFFQKRPVRSGASLTPADGNDIPPIATPEVASVVFYWAALAFGFAVVQLEFSAFFHHFDAFRHPMLTVLWCVLGGYLLLKARAGGGDAMDVFVKVMIAVIAIAVNKLLFVDMGTWGLSGFVYRGEFPNIQFIGRLLDFGVILGLLWCVWRLTPGVAYTDALRNAVGYLGVGILFLYLNLELKTFLHWKLPGFEAGGISILWAVFAIALVVPGIVKSVRGLRIAGLTLFGFTVIKVFLSDLSGMDIVFRVIAAVVVGIVLLLGSFAYIHSSARFKQEQTPDLE